MKKKELTVSAKLLMYLFTATSFIPKPFESKTGYLKRQLFGKVPYKSYYMALLRLQKRGLITIFKEDGFKFVKLTQRGQLEALFEKSKLPTVPNSWDGKWRLVIFDIPESSREKRELIRLLLKRNGFVYLQGSVFISPYPINREGVEYLKKSGLQKYIRMLKVDEMDEDSDLLRRFNLKKPKAG